MIYIDSSSLLKLLWEETESAAVRDVIAAAEDQVVVSSLAELETEVQLRAKWLDGNFTKARCADYRAVLASFRETAPFDFRELPGAVFQRALQQHRDAEKLHCRTLDRLHLNDGRGWDAPALEQRHQASRCRPRSWLRSPPRDEMISRTFAESERTSAEFSTSGFGATTFARR